MGFGVPSWVNLLRTHARVFISLICRSKSMVMRPEPKSLRQCVLVSTKDRRWYPTHLFQRALPRCFDALIASLRSLAAGLSGFHRAAFLRSGMMALAPLSAMALRQFRVS